MTFLYPAAAWGLVALPVFWWIARRRRDRVHLAIRLGLVAVLILALMQPSVVRRAGAGVQVVVLDQRDSLGAAGRAAARGALGQVLAAVPAGARRVLVQIGGQPVAAAVDARETLSGASLSQALSRALAAMPLGSEGAITLITDGRSTDRHWDEQRAAITRRGIAANTVAVPVAPHTAYIASVRAAAARVGEAVTVTIDVEGDGASHRVALYEGDRRVAASAPIVAEGTTRVALSFPAERAGFVPIRAVLDGGADMETAAAVQDPLRLLYLGERQVEAAAQVQRLLGRGFAVTDGSPAAIGDAARWPLVLLDDLPAAHLPAPAQLGLARAVADAGTGLIASGGTAAFGPGGYAATPLAHVLPVTAKQDEKLEKPSIALAIVIDSSGSMQGLPLDLAKQIARQTVRKLTPSDWVGVVEFYGGKQWAVPIQPARDTPAVERAIGRMEAQGASMLFPALQEAYFGLKDVAARYKHILVISDGGVAEDRYQQLLRHIADDRINVSTAVVGSEREGEENMAAWARIGRGRFYSVADEFSLVALDFRQPQIKPDTGYRSGGFPVRLAPGALGWTGSAPPPLTGYARVTARPESETLMTTQGADPVLARWQYGAGRVAALATEPVGAGTQDWRGWGDYGRWLARLAATTARQRPAMDVAIERRFDRLRVSVQMLGTAGVPALRLLDRSRKALPLVPALEPRAPGLFVADFPYPPALPVLVEARAGDEIVRAADPAHSDVSAGDAMPAANTLPLAALAADSGGWHRADPAAAPGTLRRGAALAAVDLWPWLALLALLLYLADIGWRRRPAGRS